MKLYYTLLLLASIVVAGFAAGVADIKDDIEETLSNVKALDAAIKKIKPSGGTLPEGIVIDSSVIKMEKALDKGTQDVETTPKFSSDVSKDVLAAFKTTVEDTLHLLKDIVTKKSSIVKTPVPGIASLVRDALKKLQASFDVFQNALIESYSEDVKDEARSIKTEIDTAFTNAVRVYS